MKNHSLWLALAKETAHQLGTPVSSIEGWLDILKIRLNEHTSQKIPKQLEHVLNEITHDINKLKKITARFSQIGTVPKLTPNDLNNIIKDTVDYYSERLAHSRNNIKIKFSKNDLPPVMINRDLFEWVFENLIKNSIEAISQKGEIEIKTLYKDKHIIITHSDTGTGIKKSLINKIFEPNYSTKKGGWGIGLTLVKRIVNEYHNGEITVKSPENQKGSIFTITIPEKINDPI